MRLILTRHGETVENLGRILQGHLDGKLSEKGLWQARRIAFRFCGERLDAIYSSDLRRAVEGALEISKYHKETLVHYRRYLRETDLGDWTGKGYDEIDAQNPPANLETNENLQVRAQKFLNEVAKYSSDSTILEHTHNWINKAILSLILEQPASYIKDAEDFDNASVSVVELDCNSNNILVFNSVRHLRD